MAGSLPRIAILVAAALFLAAVAATITFAAGGGTAPVTPVAAPVPQAQPELVVPDVRHQPYVFAKSTLEEGGFAWQVRGAVQGFAANEVASQSPAPGTRLVDTGTPLVVLTLARNAKYKQEGAPENTSSYRGTAVRLVGAPAVAPKPAAAPKAAPAAKAKPKPAAAPKKAAAPAKPAQKTPRPVAFVVAGAKPEPLDEMPLPDRARALARWLEKHPQKTPANANHWLYQHSWIVTGARMGWWRGAEALRELVKVDQRAQKVWGFGARSEQLARAALAEVEAHGA
jgi:hypothetical protein